MLVGIAMLAGGGQSAFAEEFTLTPSETTVIQANGTSDGNTGNADKVFYDATATAWRCSYSTISNNAFTNKLSSYDGTPVVITKFDASVKLAGLTVTKATLTFKSVCTVSGKNSNVQIALIGTGWDAATATWNSTNTAAIMAAVNLNGDGTNVKTTQMTLTQDVTEQLKSDEDKVIGFGIYTKTGREQEVSDFTLTIEAIDASASATYTVKYVDESGNEIKTATSYTESIGADAALKDEDKASIYNDDNTKKYIYASDDSEGKTVASDGSTVVTVTFREAAIYSYVFNAVDADGNTLKEGVVKGTNFEGETFNVGYPTYVEIDSVLYKSSKLSSDKKGYYISLTLDEDNKTTDVAYSATEIKGVVYYSEAEDISGLTKATNSNTGIRSSNGASAYAADNDVVFTTLPAGKYTLSTVICDASKKAGSTWYFLAGNDTIYTFTAGTVNWSEGTSSEFTLNGETSIALAKGGNKNAAVDLIYIQKTGDVISVTKTIPDFGYASFSHGCNVEVPSDVTVYGATVGDDATEVVLREITTSVIPANTGVLLYSDVAGEKTFNVTTEAATADFTTNNALLPTSLEANATVPAEGTYYGLRSDKAEFALVKNGISLSRDKAYLAAPASSAKTLRVVIGGTTAITDVNTQTATVDGALYTLQGVRVAKPTTGLYIQNGKKVIIKK